MTCTHIAMMISLIWHKLSTREIRHRQGGPLFPRSSVVSEKQEQNAVITRVRLVRWIKYFTALVYILLSNWNGYGEACYMLLSVTACRAENELVQNFMTF